MHFELAYATNLETDSCRCVSLTSLNPPHANSSISKFNCPRIDGDALTYIRRWIVCRHKLKNASTLAHSLVSPEAVRVVRKRAVGVTWAGVFISKQTSLVFLVTQSLAQRIIQRAITWTTVAHSSIKRAKVLIGFKSCQTVTWVSLAISLLKYNYSDR